MDPLMDGFADWHLSPKLSEALDIVAPSTEDAREGLEITLDQEDVGVTLKILMDASKPFTSPSAHPPYSPSKIW